MNTLERIRALRARTGIAAATAMATLAIGACNVDKIVTIEDPEIVTSNELLGKAALPSLLAGAIGNFQLAFSGSSGSEGQVTMSALLGDEFRVTDTFGTRIEIDQRDIEDRNAQVEGIFRSLSRSRGFSEEVARKYVELFPTAATPADTTNFRNGRAESLALAGYSYILFAENFCADKIPFSEVSGDQIVTGPVLARDSVLARALQRFDTSLAVASLATGGTATSLARLARIGRARVYLNRADTYSSAFLDSAQAAIGGAAGVPTTYQYQVLHSSNTGRENNGVFIFNVNQRRVTETDSEGVNGLFYRRDFVNGVDVRTAWAPTTLRGFDRTPASRMALTNKYPERAAPVTLASGAEARLIEAEVALRKGDIPTWIARLNDLRTTAANLLYNQCHPLAIQNGTCTNPTRPLPKIVATLTTSPADSIQEPGAGAPATPGTAAQQARENFMFRERAFWMYLTSHRLGDMRRLVRQLGRPVNSVFPSGIFVRTTISLPSYGNDVAFPVPFAEQNNPAFRGQSCDNTLP